MKWRVEQRFVSRLGQERWLPIGHGSATRGEAEAAVQRLRRFLKGTYRIVEVPA